MSNTESLITQPQKARLLVIREYYLAICDGDHCAATLLNWFEQWTNTKLDAYEQHEIKRKAAAEAGVILDPLELWVYAGQDELGFEMMGLFGERKIADSLKWLCEVGFLEKRNNPKYGWDRKFQYLFDIEYVQFAVDEIAASIPQNCDIKGAELRHPRRKKAGAIPMNASPNASENTPTPNGGRQRNALYDAIESVWGWVGALNGDWQKMLSGTATKKGYKEYNFDPAATADEIVAWAAWWKRSNPGLSMLEQHGKVQSSFYQWRKLSKATAPRAAAPALTPEQIAEMNAELDRLAAPKPIYGEEIPL